MCAFTPTVLTLARWGGSVRRDRECRTWGWGIHRFKSGVFHSPPRTCLLAAANENTPPQPVDSSLKGAQRSRVPRDSMALVIAFESQAKVARVHEQKHFVKAATQVTSQKRIASLFPLAGRGSRFEARWDCIRL